MRLLVFPIFVFFLVGCRSQPVDLSNAYWGGKDNPRAHDANGWPLWDKAPQKGVKIGARSIPEMDRLEYVGFVWDETGLYGRVFAFTFPDIRITVGKDEEHKVLIAADGSGRMRQTLGTIHAWKVGADRRTELAREDFLSVDRGWVMKPGQCQAEFWVSWRSFGSGVPPTQRVLILVGQHVLTLDAKRGVP